MLNEQRSNLFYPPNNYNLIELENEESEKMIALRVLMNISEGSQNNYRGHKFFQLTTTK